MSTLIVGDVHGCAAELKRLLQAVVPTEVILVGDLFSKGPDPLGTWELLREWNARSVLGNHDDHLLKRWDDGLGMWVKDVFNLRDETGKVAREEEEGMWEAGGG